jgi:hypothetical protein
MNRTPIGRRLCIAALCAILIVPSFAAVRAQEADLDAVKTYLLETVAELKAETERLNAAAAAYYDLAAAVDFDYAAVAADADAAALVLEAQAAWTAASPLYEKIEGIVAGVPSLSEYDVILDAGGDASDPETAVPFDLTLPDGRVLVQPGNLFGILEGTLFGTRADFNAGIDADLNADGEIAFGESLPEANILRAAAESIDGYTAELVASAEAWTPNETDAFTALVVMVPTMNEYFNSWKDSRFIAGADAASAEFAVISRLADIQDILSGLQVVYAGISPLVNGVDAEQDAQIAQSLDDLRLYVADLRAQEQAGRRFTAEEADFYGSEAQARADAITGQIAQMAALLNITLPE